MVLLLWWRGLLLLLLSVDRLALRVGKRPVEEARLRVLLLDELGLAGMPLIHLPVSRDALRCSWSHRTIHLRGLGIPLLTRRSAERRLASFVHRRRRPSIAILRSVREREDMCGCRVNSLYRRRVGDRWREATVRGGRGDGR